MKILMIDLSGFSRPYNHCLYNALVEQGCSVELITSKSIYPYHLQNGKY